MYQHFHGRTGVTLENLRALPKHKVEVLTYYPLMFGLRQKMQTLQPSLLSFPQATLNYESLSSGL